MWLKQTRSMFHELLKGSSSTPIQHHGLVFTKSRWCHTLSAASCPQVKTSCSTLNTGLQECSVPTRAEGFHVNMIPHDFLAFLRSYNRIQFEITDLSSNWHFSNRNAAAAKNHSLYKRLSKTSIPFLPSFPSLPSTPSFMQKNTSFPSVSIHLYGSVKPLKNPPCTSPGLKLALWQKLKGSHAWLSNQWSHTVQYFTSTPVNGKILPSREVLKYSTFMLTY